MSKKVEATIDSIISTEFKDKNAPGGAFMVTLKGKPVYKKAFGKANLELNVDMNPDSIFQIGSMTKQFTAIAIFTVGGTSQTEGNRSSFKIYKRLS